MAEGANYRRLLHYFRCLLRSISPSRRFLSTTFPFPVLSISLPFLALFIYFFFSSFRASN